MKCSPAVYIFWTIFRLCNGCIDKIIFLSANRKERIMYFITMVLWMKEDRKRRRKTWPRCTGITGGQREEEDQQIPMAVLTTES